MLGGAFLCGSPMSARTVLSFSRDLEFVSQTELAKRMGCQPSHWLRATLKELIDNALDACEEAGVEPEIRVDVHPGKVLSVADNGPGIPPELVARQCDRSRRTSTREAYAAPDCGSQGNALQTIMCLQFGFGLDDAGIVVASRGVTHKITLRVNRLAQVVEIEHDADPCEATPGTSVFLSWPEPVDHNAVWWLINDHAWLNPHATFHLTTADGSATWEATAPVKKWTPGLPIPPHWYTANRFTHAPGTLGDHHVTWLCQTLQTRCQVRRLADHRFFLSRALAHKLADHDHARSYADPCRERPAPCLQPCDCRGKL
jgi:hypothetical protein